MRMRMRSFGRSVRLGTGKPLPRALSAKANLVRSGICNYVYIGELSMRRLLLALCLFACAINFPLQSQEQQTKALGHYLFAWTGAAAHKGNDFLAVIDADPASISYGQLMTTIATDQRTVRIHPHRIRHARQWHAVCQRS